MKEGYLRPVLGRSIQVVLGVLAVCALSFEAQAESPKVTSTQFSAASIQNLIEVADGYKTRGARSTVSLRLPAGSESVLARLEPHDIRSPRYRAEISTARGQEPDPIQVDLFKGTVDLEQGSEFYRFALIRDTQRGTSELRGYFRSNETFYKVELVPGQKHEYSVSSLSVEDVQGIVAKCGLESHHVREFVEHDHAHDHLHAHDSPPIAEATLSQVQIATDADFEYVQAEGGQSGANATILSILNAVDAIYRAQLSSTLSVTFQNAWTVVNDPYTSSDSSTLLDEFRTHWEANFSSVQTYDIAHLFTGRDLNGSVIGVAFLSALCSSFRYGLSERLNSTAADVPLVAHELGHNFGSDHDNCGLNDEFVMCPSLILGVSTFSTSSRAQIASHVGSVSCLTNVDDGNGGGSNNAPVLSSIGAQSVVEGQTLNLTFSASDSDGDTLSFSISTLSGASLSGANFSYTPPSGTVPNGQTSTAVTVTVTVSDGTTTDSETVTITVSTTDSGNTTPVLNDPGSVSVNEGQLLSVQLSASDADGDAITFSAVGDLPAGSVLGSSTGLFTWTPGGNQAGSYSVGVRATDTSGASDSKTLQITVNNVDGVPDLPDSHVLGDFEGSGNAQLAVFRNSTGQWFSDSLSSSNVRSALTTVQFGLGGDIPVPGDYDGDRRTDRAVFRESSATWFILNSSTSTASSVAFGVAGDLPVGGGDFDGDGRDDVAIYRPSVGLFIYRPSSNESANVVISVGQAGDIPVPCDYDGDGDTDVTVFRPTSGAWITSDGTNTSSVTLGLSSDIPVPGDYNGNDACERTVYRPSTGEWISESLATVQFGLGGDIPVPAEYTGSGSTNYAVFRPAEANWYVRDGSGGAMINQLGLPTDLIPSREAYYFATRRTNGSGVQARGELTDSMQIYRASSQTLFVFGLNTALSATIPASAGDYVIRGDYDGDDALDTATYSAGVWTLYLATGAVETRAWGLLGDIPIAGDFDGDGTSDLTVYRSDVGGGFSAWFVLRSSDGTAAIYNWGVVGDTPIAADFNGDGWTDPAVWRESLGTWFVLDARSSAPIQTVQWGLPGDVIRVADFDNDGRADKIAWRPSVGTWFVLLSSGSSLAQQWGVVGDIPVPGTYVNSGAVDFGVYRPSDGSLYVLTLGQAGFVRASGLSSSDQVVAINPNVPVQ